MKNRTKLDHIANGFYAANKMRNTYRNNMRQNENSTERTNNTALAGQMLDIITQHSPQKSREALKKTLEISNQYAKTYKDLKQHFNSRDGGKVDRHNFVRTLSLVHPILGIKQQRVIEKIMKLYDLFT